eukprot:SAG22_NODE_834_length_6927_cov_7.202402_6_plen_98_part_00
MDEKSPKKKNNRRKLNPKLLSVLDNKHAKKKPPNNHIFSQRAALDVQRDALKALSTFEAHGEHLKEAVKKQLRNIPQTNLIQCVSVGDLFCITKYKE